MEKMIFLSIMLLVQFAYGKYSLSVYCLGVQQPVELKILSKALKFDHFEINGEKWKIEKVAPIGETAQIYLGKLKSKQFQFTFRPELFFTADLLIEKEKTEVRCRYVDKVNSLQKSICDL